MSNPLARVVMNGIAQKSGKVDNRPSSVGSSSSTNLGKRGTQILTDLLNNKTNVTTSNSSYDKSTYGRSSNVCSSSNTMKSLNSLVSGNSHKTDTNNNKVEKCEIDRSRPSLKSLCSLDNISIGKPSTNNSTGNNNSYVSKNNSRSSVQTLKLDELAKGASKSESKEVKSYSKEASKQTGGMMTLGDLAGDKTKNRQEEKANDNTAIKSGYVKSNVLSNLDAYVPKVTLESIGKKGSLF